MDTYIIYEIIGYLASLLVAVSLMMSKIVRLRIVNLIGAATFSIYGILIGSIPVAAMNAFIVCINVYYLYQILTNREYLNLLRVTSDNDYLAYFIKFYRDEILKYQPDFSPYWDPDTVFIFILRDSIPSGLLIGDLDDAGIFKVRLDFVIPMYRDYKVGQYLYREQKAFFRDEGIKEIRARAGTSDQANYLRRMGFSPEPDSGEMVFQV